jgi:Gpi18-like mannosyltransferase
MQAVIDKLGIRTCLIALLAAGSVIRVVTGLVSLGHRHDLHIMGQWGWQLSHQPIDSFYSLAENPDHLPGDLWFHWALSNLFQMFGGEHYWGETYYFLLKMLPSIADVAVAILLFAIVRYLVSAPVGLLASALYFLNPAVFSVSSAWGQWDSVSMALLLAGLAIVVGRPERWILAVPLIAWATVIKPPLALPGILIIGFPLLLVLRDSPSVSTFVRRIVPSALICGALGIATIVVICAPFSVGLPGMSTQWTLIERARVALDMYPFKVLAAGNIWMLQQGSFEHVDDRTESVLGINAHDLGNISLAVALVAIGIVFVRLVFVTFRDRPFVALAWALVAVTFATYMLPTRVHERYFFPTLVLGIIMLTITRVGPVEFTALAVVSATFLANLSFVYFGFNQDSRVDIDDATFALLLRTTSILNVIAFIAVILMPLRWIGRPTLQSNRSHQDRSRREDSGPDHNQVAIGAQQ